MDTKTERESVKASRQPLSPYQWARSMVEKRALVLDTETSGLNDSAEVIELAVVDLAGTVLLNELIRCPVDIDPNAQAVHGITRNMLASARTFPLVIDDFFRLATGRAILTYNAAFDLRLLKQAASHYGLLRERFSAITFRCIMLAYSAHYGEVHPYYGTYTWQKLGTACNEFGVKVPGHRALDDAQAARQVLLALAKIER